MKVEYPPGAIYKNFAVQVKTDITESTQIKEYAGLSLSNGLNPYFERLSQGLNPCSERD